MIERAKCCTNVYCNMSLDIDTFGVLYMDNLVSYNFYETHECLYVLN